jgi:hypothetical protein
MDYIPPLNSTPTEENPRPPNVDGNLAAGQRGSYPSGRALEHPMREILSVIEAAGLTPAENNLGQLLQAIQTLVAGVGGDPVTFGYNPVYPHVTVNGGVVSVSGTNGQVVVNAGQTFIHRGGTLMTLDDFDLGERTFATVASKTYHLRWRFNAGTPLLVLVDVADGTYNPTAKAEADIAFDTTFDDMLIARVVTNGSNDTTVTALKNLSHLAASFAKTSKEWRTSPASWDGMPILTGTVNWARTPRCSIVKTDGEISSSADALTVVGAQSTRYAMSGWANGYGDLHNGAIGRYQSGAITVDLAA